MDGRRTRALRHSPRAAARDTSRVPLGGRARRADSASASTSRGRAAAGPRPPAPAGSLDPAARPLPPDRGRPRLLASCRRHRDGVGPLPRRHGRDHDHRRHRRRLGRRRPEHPARRRGQPHRRAGQPAAARGAARAAQRRRHRRAELRHDHPAARARGRRGRHRVLHPARQPTCTSRATAATRSTRRTRRPRRAPPSGWWPRAVRDPARVEAESAQEGRSTLIRAVEDLTGQTVDHYAEVNLLGFHNLTTAIGGVDVCLTRAGGRPAVRRAAPRGPADDLRGGRAGVRPAAPRPARRATCPGSAASRCSWPRSPTRSSPGGTLTDPARLAGCRGGAAVPRDRRRLGPARIRPAGGRPRRLATCSSSPSRPAAARPTPR